MKRTNEAVCFGENLENIVGWGFHPNFPFIAAWRVQTKPFVLAETLKTL
ncbi:MAG: hypothetical protein ACI4CY_08135 [Candidatus Gastranaerophilaceae bacterium]